MANDIIATPALQYQVDYERSKITIQNFDKLQLQITQVLKDYNNLAVTPDTKLSIKKSVAELRKFRKTIDDRRKEIKKDYEAPLKEFEGKVGVLTALIDETIAPLDSKVKEIDRQEKEERTDKAKALIVEMAPKYGLTPEEVEFEPNWANSITDVKRTQLIASRMKWLESEKKRIKADKDATEAYAKQVNFTPEGWVALVDQGQDFDQIKSQIDSAVFQRQQKIERAAQHKAAEEAIERARQTQVNLSSGTQTVDTTTGEIIPPKPELHTRAMRVTATVKQLWALAQYMDDNGIKYESIQEG